jgi:hypothetical protein
MRVNTEDLKRLRVAQARWRVEVAQGSLIAHRNPGRNARTALWKVEDAHHAQKAETAHSHLRFVASERGEGDRPRPPLARRWSQGIRGYLRDKLAKISR